MKLWALIFTGVVAVATVSTAVLMLKEFFQIRRSGRMKERMYLLLQNTGRINIAELVEAGVIQKKETSLAFKACCALAHDCVGEFQETNFYIKGRMPHYQ